MNIQTPSLRSAAANSSCPARARCRFFVHLLAASLSCLFLADQRLLADWPVTRAESSSYEATSTYEEIMAFGRALERNSKRVKMIEFGTTVEGRKLPLIVLSESGIGSASEARTAKKPVILCVGTIHGGEVCGKEALLMLAREFAQEKEATLLGEFVLLFAPILNADGNERVSNENRPGQNGPIEGMGERENASGLDLNRDFVKLEAPETRALVGILNEWDPLIVIDTHTTNGSQHRYLITYDGPRHPATDHRILDFVRDQFLPAAGEKLATHSGYDSFFYGNFEENRTRWTTYPALPRYGVQYLGIRNRIGILAEAYAYAPFRDRVLGTKEFVRFCLQTALDHKKRIQSLIEKADQRALRRGAGGKSKLPTRIKAAPQDEKVLIKGFDEPKNQTDAANRPKDYEVEFWGRAEAIEEARLPYAYLIPPDLTEVIVTLQRHGIEVMELREDIELEMERYRVESIKHAIKEYQNHHLATLKVTPSPGPEWARAGWKVVFAGQKLGQLAGYLLEPESEDGLAAWNFFDASLAEGQDFPIRRLLKPIPLLTVAARPLGDDRPREQPITFDTLFGKDKVDFNGSPARIETWAEDGRHYLQVRDGQLRSVHAESGRSQPFFSTNKLAQALQKLPTIDAKTAQSISQRTRFEMNPDRTGAWFEHEKDLYFLRFDGSEAIRLTATPEEEELVSFSPSGQFLAFVRNLNLFVVDLATRTERALTTDGGGDIRNGKADWIYFEELYHRNWKAYWWSPDSRQIAFHQFDSSALPMFHALNTLPLHGQLESMRHPKAGDPNPQIKLGVVSAAGGSVRWIDLSEYLPGSYIISQAGWFPDSETIYYYVQDRIQTWLDFKTWSPASGKSETLFRDQTKAWIESPGDPHFLKNGSFLVTSERSGWNHLYRFQPKSKKWKTVTEGEWEVRKVHLVDRTNRWIYFTGTRDSHIAEHFYRCRFNGESLERLTPRAGHHRVQIDPAGQYFIDTWSDFETPDQVRLYRTDGSFVRTLDTNPVFAWEEYQLGDSTLFQIESRDGFEYEASWTFPPDFNPEKRYPVWFMTYAGPHAPTVRNAWSRNKAYDQMLARMGLIVFRMDPRSASGKGAVSAWTAYRKLGVQELEDITEAIEWLKEKPFVNGSRIGMSGHSYGGFMTAYAMTHSKLFAAGISGAPVTDWRYYDTIYTERYMDTPQGNPEGYNQTSVVKGARNLHGRLLLLHGMMDDNVHLQNATQLMDALHKAEKEFEVMFYPEMKHGLYGQHYQKLLVDFIRRSVLKEEE